MINLKRAHLGLTLCDLRMAGAVMAHDHNVIMIIDRVILGE